MTRFRDRQHVRVPPVATALASLLFLAFAPACTKEQIGPLTEARGDALREPELRSLFDEPLYRPEFTLEKFARLTSDLDAAGAARLADPRAESGFVWQGRRLGYLWRYNDAVGVFTEGLAVHPRSAQLLRHRGHRYITLRKFGSAIADLERAARLVDGAPDEVEPDGQPNAHGVPRSTLQTNIHYHLGLARYLTGDFNGAADAWRRCLALSKNDDMRVAASYWLYLGLLRAQRAGEAVKVLEPVSPGMDVIENSAYYSLLLYFKGDLAREQLESMAEAGGVDASTIRYGLGAQRLAQGRPEAARAEFERARATGQWSAFGFIAAEAELHRLRW